MSSVVAVIPARYASTRFPGKPLVDIHGKPMVQWVYERARRAKGVTRVVVATDDARIEKAVQTFGGEVMMTSPDHATGTDRLAEVADRAKAEVYVNVQGDEPMIEPAAIERAVELVTSKRFPMATVMTRLKTSNELHDPSVVKVIADKAGRAIYFSRLPIPYSRGAEPASAQEYACLRHVGLYVYDHATLMRFRALKPAALEQGEVLEQLRAIADGIPIGIAEVNFASIGVDTPEDLEKVRRLLV
jgi:3-deoxy-manno-octulosonate cytidylyltransferase (CMP-KDO synthetase)